MKNNLRNALKYLPLLAIVPESYAVGLAIDKELGWHFPVVVISALLVAGTGFWGVQVTNAMAEFNATMRNKKERDLKLDLPTYKGWRVLLVWFSAVTLITLFLDVWPVLRDLTPILLVIVGGSASYLFSLSNLHASAVQERLAHREDVAKDKEDARNQKQADRKAARERRQAEATKRKEITQLMEQRGIKMQPKSGAKISNEILLVYWDIDPTMTPTQMATRLVEDNVVEKISRQAIKGRLDDMVKKNIVTVQDGQVVTYRVGEGSGSESDS